MPNTRQRLSDAWKVFYKIIKISLDFYFFFFANPLSNFKEQSSFVILPIDLAYQAIKPCKTTTTENIIHKPNIA